MLLRLRTISVILECLSLVSECMVKLFSRRNSKENHSFISIWVLSIWKNFSMLCRLKLICCLCRKYMMCLNIGKSYKSCLWIGICSCYINGLTCLKICICCSVYARIRRSLPSISLCVVLLIPLVCVECTCLYPYDLFQCLHFAYTRIRRSLSSISLEVALLISLVCVECTCLYPYYTV